MIWINTFKFMLWVLKRTVSLTWFLLAPTTYWYVLVDKFNCALLSTISAGQAPSLQNNFHTNSAEHEIYRAHKC